MSEYSGSTPIDRGAVTVIRAGWIAAWNGNHHQIIENGEVAFQNDRIRYAGPRYEGHADITLERRNWFLCPGFINLHGHVGLELNAGLVDTVNDERFAPSREYCERAPLNQEPSLTPEEQHLSGEFSLVQMLRTGTTTIVDAAGSGPIWWIGNPPRDEELLCETVGRLGCRAYLSLSHRSARAYQNQDGTRGWHWDEEMGMNGLRQSLEFAQKHRGKYSGRVDVILTPHTVDNCSPELLKATLEMARADDLLVQIHAAQYLYEVEFVRARYGKTPIGHLHEIGFLGPDIIVGHCIYVSGHPALDDQTDRDLHLIAAAESSVAHSPLPFARRGEALHSLSRYLNVGITVGIGCDIWPADIIAEMRLAWFISKQVSQSAGQPTCLDVFHAATVGSADALHRSDLGRLSAGAKADIVCIDLSGHHFGPVLDPIRALITCGTGQDVDSVFVDGQLVVDNATVVNARHHQLREAVPAILQSMFAAASERDPLARTATSLLGD